MVEEVMVEESMVEALQASLFLVVVVVQEAQDIQGTEDMWEGVAL